MVAANDEMAAGTSTLPMTGRAAFAALGLAAANLGLLLIYVTLDLTPVELVLVFWWETFWIGTFAALKLLVASVAGEPWGNRFMSVSPGAALLVSLVAIGFVVGEFLAIFFLSGAALYFALSALTGIDPGELLRDQFRLILGSSLLFLAGHGLSFVVNFLLLGEFRTARGGALLALPFTRCLALLFAIGIACAAAWLLPEFARTTAFVAALVLIKLLIDYRLHRHERRVLAPSPPTPTRKV